MSKHAWVGLALGILSACGGHGNGGLRTVAEGSDQGLAVEMLAEAPLHVGLNRVYYRLTVEASGDPVHEAHIEQRPVMHMDMHSNGCPVTDPPATADAEGLFAGEVVFTMPSGEGTWDQELTIHRPATGTTHGPVLADLAVGPGLREALAVGEGPDERVLLLTLTFAEAPHAGLNDFVLTVHEREGPFLFPPQTDLTMTVVPFMPAHGHGAAGSVDPIHTGHGQYEGAANFTMPGWWTLDFVIEGLDTVQFEVTF
jgi:hypothetical protein